MNAAQVIILKGTATESGFVTWSIPVPDDDPIEADEIYCNGGFYWLLANITIDDPQTMADQCKFEWDLDKLTPQSSTLETRTHVHVTTNTAGSSVDSNAGPRLVYQSPHQFWSYGQIDQGTRLKLDVETACEVELIAIRHSILADIDTMALELR
jgi:hypothetical protein